MNLGSAESERLILASVVAHARDAVIITLAGPVSEPPIVYVNPAFERMTGFAAADVLGKTARVLQGPETNAHARRRIRAALETWQPIEIELLNYRKNGTTFWVELSLVPIANETGHFTHWLSVQRDVSARKASDEILLRARVAEERASELALEIDRRRSVEARLAYAASHDELTGLKNRAYLVERLRFTIDAAAHGGIDAGLDFCVLFLDLDRFKLVNDSLGHTNGDTLLRIVADRIRAATRPDDTLARIGGDEFVLVLERTPLATAMSVATRVIDSLAEPFDVDGRSVVTASSIGVAAWQTDHDTPERLIRDADTAMYHAKMAGGNCARAFARHMHERAVASLQRQTDIRLALDRREFHLVFQPLFDTTTTRPYGMEALIRWNHAELGPIAPSDFIPVAEEIGLIGCIDAWVFRRACAASAAWRAVAGESFAMSVNASSREILDPQYFEMIRDAVAAGVRPDHIVIEITESVLMLGADVAGPTIAALRELGVKIALDDFGTGYSSLGYLERFELDILKIDRLFVSGVSDPASSKRQIVRTIVTLAETLGIEVVAEGVEHAAQRDALIDMGCRKMQGYLFSKPLSETDALAYLASYGHR